MEFVRTYAMEIVKEQREARQVSSMEKKKTVVWKIIHQSHVRVDAFKFNQEMRIRIVQLQPTYGSNTSCLV